MNYIAFTILVRFLPIYSQILLYILSFYPDSRIVNWVSCYPDCCCIPLSRVHSMQKSPSSSSFPLSTFVCWQVGVKMVLALYFPTSYWHFETQFELPKFDCAEYLLLGTQTKYSSFKAMTAYSNTCGRQAIEHAINLMKDC